ncbi:twin transmembrane helix small protein [Cupriavidus basilensis]|uniref:Putative transmembrane protein n=1 Tax=Cupriavidus basilensis TaxID=68895 RepID=A0A0C4XZ55_9BURK|nr:twin transmembrane helix small protein [Cupriavidus basilensis]AJG17802.1 putative transmembrane protein [Cupriavidus basilensis]
MRIVILIAFFLIIGSLASALFFMMRDRGGTPNMMRSLMFRVGFSVALFVFILFSHWMGWIQSTGIRMAP